MGSKLLHFRISDEDHARLVQAMKAEGFENVSEYVRAALRVRVDRRLGDRVTATECSMAMAGSKFEYEKEREPDYQLTCNECGTVAKGHCGGVVQMFIGQARARGWEVTMDDGIEGLASHALCFACTGNEVLTCSRCGMLMYGKPVAGEPHVCADCEHVPTCERCGSMMWRGLTGATVCSSCRDKEASPELAGDS